MKNLPYLSLVLAGLFLSSCGTFERDWKKSVTEYRSGKVATPAGPWVGSWKTDTNGHSGALRAIVTPVANQPDQYDFHYHATWSKILAGTFKVRYPVIRRGNSYLANGEKKLGPFGTFGHQATLSKNSFQATYSSEHGELGKFELARPE